MSKIYWLKVCLERRFLRIYFSQQERSSILAQLFWVVAIFASQCDRQVIPPVLCSSSSFAEPSLGFQIQGASSLYSWSISQILEHEFFCLGHLGSSGSKKKSEFEFFWSTFKGVFFTFCGQKKLYSFLNIVVSPLKSCLMQICNFLVGTS